MKIFLNKIIENFLIAFRALNENRMRSILTTGGIIIGVLTVVSVSSIVEGLNQAVSNMISDIGSSTLYIQKHSWMEENWFETKNRADIKMKDVDFLKDNIKTSCLIMPSTQTRKNINYKDN